MWIGLKPSQPYLPFTKACDSINLLNFVLVQNQKEAEASLAVWMTNQHRAHMLTKVWFWLQKLCVSLLKDLISCTNGCITLNESSKGSCHVRMISYFSRIVQVGLHFNETFFLFRNFGLTCMGVLN